MILGVIPDNLADLRCPDCGARQSVHVSTGFKSRIRSPAHLLPCPGCQAPLSMSYAEGGQFREGLGWGTAAVVLVALFVVAAPVFEGLRVSPALLWPAAAAGALMLYLGALAATGLVMRWSRRMVKP